MSDMIFSNKKSIQKIFPKLLKDQTTRKNIIWATDTYETYGKDFQEELDKLFKD